jgi:alcohol dehydrogenase
VGSAYGTTAPQLLVPRLLALYRCGTLPLDDLILDRYPLAEIDHAFDRARAAEGLRSVIKISDEGLFRH